MLGCKATDNPIEVNVKLREGSESPLVDKGIYQRSVGRLICLSHTRLDIICSYYGESIYAFSVRASYGSSLSHSSLLKILTR
jgi:hypothetical protein